MVAHEEFIRAVVKRLLIDDNRVDDAVQETWLRALDKPPRARRALRTWLARVARNVALTMLRKEKRVTRREQAAAHPNRVGSTAEAAGRSERMRQVVNAVFGLDEPYRTTIIERFYERLSVSEVAARHRISGAAARKRVARAMDMLRQRLDERHGGDLRAWCLALLPLVSAPAADDAALVAQNGTVGVAVAHSASGHDAAECAAGGCTGQDGGHDTAGRAVGSCAGQHGT